MKSFCAILATVLFVTCPGLLSPIYGQWQKSVIDDDISEGITVDIADLTGDGKPELIVADYQHDRICWYENNYPKWKRYTRNAPGVVMAYGGDIDGNGTMDIVANLWKSRQLVWYENDPPTWPLHFIDQPTPNADIIHVVDVEGDDTLDVVTGGSLHVEGRFVWYENNYPEWTQHIIDRDRDKRCWMRATDIDGDGINDIFVTLPEKNDIVWYKTKDNGMSWEKYVIDDNFSNIMVANVGDINGDGAPDIVAGNGGPYFSGSTVVWYENNLPSPTWPKHVIDSKLAGATWVEIADVDGDDTMDVFAGGFHADDVVWYKNNNLTWSKHEIDPNLDGPRVMFLTDVDGDKTNDIVAAALDRVTWYKNPYTKVAFGNSLEVFPKYLQPQQKDTLEIMAQISNPEDHQVKVHAIIQGENSVFKDSLEMFDDGLHNDGSASDNVFGGLIFLPELDKDYFEVDLLTTDIDDSVTTFCAPKEFFSTIGPLTVDHYEISKQFSNRFQFNLFIKNNDLLTSLADVRATLSTADSNVTEIRINDITLGTIEANQIKANSAAGFYVYTQNDPDKIKFDVQICKGDKFFWSDTITISLKTDVIVDDMKSLPYKFELCQNYPNPFNPGTAIDYSIPKQSFVTITVFDVQGREVATLVNKEQPQGHHQVNLTRRG